MKFLEPYVLKRAGFMFAIMFPVLLILEYTGHTSTAATALLAGVTGGVSVILFPNPTTVKKLDEKFKNDKLGKK